MELLNNSAFMGFVGVIIGSLVSFLTAMYSEHIKSKNAKEERIHETQKATAETKQRLYCQYLEYVYQGMILNGMDNDDDSELLELMSKKLPSVLAELTVFAPKEINTACSSFCWDALKNSTNDEYYRQRDKIIEMMRSDLKSSTIIGLRGNNA